MGDVNSNILRTLITLIRWKTNENERIIGSEGKVLILHWLNDQKNILSSSANSAMLFLKTIRNWIFVMKDKCIDEMWFKHFEELDLRTAVEDLANHKNQKVYNYSDILLQDIDRLSQMDSDLHPESGENLYF